MGDLLYPDPVPTSDRTLEQACAELDLPIAFAQRFFIVALQLPAPAPDRRMREDDLELLRIAATVFNMAGRNENVGIASARYFGENLRRLAESQVRFFREQFEEPMFEMGLSQREAIELLVQVAAPLIPLGARTVDLLYQRHLEHHSMEDIVANMEMTMRRAGLVQETTDHMPVVAFLRPDRLHATHGGAGRRGRGADGGPTCGVAPRDDCATRGRVVKLLGDGAMLYFHGPAGAARAGLELVGAASEAELRRCGWACTRGPSSSATATTTGER
jgi:hypothetical protein